MNSRLSNLCKCKLWSNHELTNSTSDNIERMQCRSTNPVPHDQLLNITWSTLLLLNRILGRQIEASPQRGCATSEGRSIPPWSEEWGPITYKRGKSQQTSYHFKQEYNLINTHTSNMWRTYLPSYVPVNISLVTMEMKVTDIIHWEGTWWEGCYVMASAYLYQVSYHSEEINSGNSRQIISFPTYLMTPSPPYLG